MVTQLFALPPLTGAPAGLTILRVNVTRISSGPRVLSLYEGFFSGGARILHTSVVRALDATTSQRHAVLSLTNRSHREFTSQALENDTSYRRLTAAGIAIQALDRGSDQPLSSNHLAMLQRAVAQSDVIVSLKEQPLAALRQVGTRGRPLFTCLHRSDPEHQGAALDALVGLHEQGLLTAAICCAASTQAAYHAATGIPLEKLPVVPNGVDLFKFRPIADLRQRVRRRLGAADSAPVIVMAARFDEMKNVPLFVRSAAVFVRDYPDAHLVLCGAGMSPDNPHLVSLLESELGHWSGRHSQVRPLGIQSSMAQYYNAADLVALTSSFGEAAPLCLLEGMACGAVPVTTDVGDAATMVGDPRLVAAPDPEVIAEAWAGAFEQREEHAERILRHRQRLSEQRCFDAYTSLITTAYAGARRSLAVAG